jgi:hypothetical protein
MVLWFVLSIPFPFLIPHIPSPRDVLVLKPPPQIATTVLPDDMTIGDVIQTPHLAKAELLGLEPGGYARIRYIEGTMKGVIDIMKIELLRPIHSTPILIP